MSLFFKVEAGAIVEGPRSLPKVADNISVFHLLSAADLKMHGWLPEERVGFEPFDAATEVREGPVHDIQADKVVSTYLVRAKTAQELDEEKTATLMAELERPAFRALVHAMAKRLGIPPDDLTADMKKEL